MTKSLFFKFVCHFVPLFDLQSAGVFFFIYQFYPLIRLEVLMAYHELCGLTSQGPLYIDF
jgi:hypothetical protein